MNTMKSIDEGLRQTEITARKNYLIRQLHRMEIYYSADGRELTSLSLYSLEWMYVEARNEVTRQED